MRRLFQTDRAFLELLRDRPKIPWQVVLTKCDQVTPALLGKQVTLVTKDCLEFSKATKSNWKQPTIMVSAKTNAGIDVMRRQIQRVMK